MMYCLRSYIPLLLLPLPLSLSPVYLTILLALTYFLNRPCIYCSFLLVILFASSCHWSGRCFVDFSYKPVDEGGAGIATWFIPRLYTTEPSYEGEAIKFVAEIANNTVTAVAKAAYDNLKNKVAGSVDTIPRQTWNDTGVGLGWLKSLLGRSEWTLPCTQFRVVL